MASLKKKDTASTNPLEEFAPRSLSAAAPAPGKSPVGKRVRKISPLGMRILVQLRSDTNVSEGGLYLPEGAKQALAESLLAEVVEVASAVDEHTDEEANISGVPLGAVVLIPKQAGVKVPWNDELRIVETKEVLAIVHEIEIV